LEGTVNDETVVVFDVPAVVGVVVDAVRIVGKGRELEQQRFVDREAL
jgi:hypothetical protein